MSVAIHGDSSYMICWDVQCKVAKHDGDAKCSRYSLSPAAHLEMRGLKVERGYDSWTHMQASHEGESIIIAVRASYKDTGMR